MLQSIHICTHFFCYTINKEKKEGNAMLDLLMIIVFCWLFFKALGLVFRLAWGVTKFLVGLLVTAAAVTLVGGVLFAGGLVLLLPIALVGIALGLLKAVV